MFGQHNEVFGLGYKIFGQHYQTFGSADQKFNCLNPRHFLVGLTKNEVQSDQNYGQPNQIAICLSQSSQKVGSAYKISMNI